MTVADNDVMHFQQDGKSILRRLTFATLFMRTRNKMQKNLKQMLNFWDFRAWGSFNLFAALLTAMLAANVLKRKIKFLQASLIPTSVLGGGILIAIAGTYKLITGNIMFDEPFFGQNGTMSVKILLLTILL